jgi:hypothetical protein
MNFKVKVQNATFSWKKHRLQSACPPNKPHNC